MKDIKDFLNNGLPYLVVLVVLLTGCNMRRDLSPTGYVNWLGAESHGLVQKKEMGNLVYELRYVTPEWMALNELKNMAPSKDEFQRTRKGYGNMSYLRFRIYDKDGSQIRHRFEDQGIDPDELEAYFNYKAENDWNMISGSDTSHCALFAFSKTYGASNEFTMELAFPDRDAENKNNRTFEWTDHITGNGPMKFLINKKDLKRIPHIRL